MSGFPTPPGGKPPQQSHIPQMHAPYQSGPAYSQLPQQFPPQGKRPSAGLLITLIIIAVICLGGSVGAGIWAALEYSERDNPRPTTSPATASIPVVPSAPPPSLPTEKKIESVDEALEELRTGTASKKTEACHWLASQPINSAKQANVGAALEKAADNASHSLNNAIVSALSIWGGPSQASTVAKMLEQRRCDAEPAIELLSKWNDISTAPAIALYLEDSRYGQKASEALKKMGKDASSAVIPYLTSNRSSAKSLATALIQDYGLDPSESIVRGYIDNLLGTDVRKREEAATNLARLKRDPKLQPEVARALDAAVRLEGTHDKPHLLEALEVWGDEQSVSSLILFVERDSLSSYRKQAVKLLGEMKAEAATASLAKLLGDFFVGEDAKQALSSIGPPARDEVARYYNSPDDRARNNARLLLQSYETGDEVYTQQSLADLKSADEKTRLYAARWLAEAPILADRRNEVVAALMERLDSDYRGMKAATGRAVVNWSTEAHVATLKTLLETRDDDLHKAALARLIEIAPPQEYAVELDKMLGSIFTRKDAYETLVAAGPAAEPVTLQLLNSSNSERVSKACEILAVVGTRTSIAPLRELQAKAARLRDRRLAQTAKAALDAVTFRQRNADVNDSP